MTNKGGRSVQVRGADRLAQTMHAAAEAIEDMSEVNRDVAGLMARETARAAPRGSGALAASVQPRATDTTATVISGHGLRYAGVQEGGWKARNIPPTHFTAKAVEAVAPAAVTAYEDAVDKALHQIKGA